MWRHVFLVGLATASVYAQIWQTLDSGTTADLRGISTVSNKVAWASGTKATILKTIDGGDTWQSVGPSGVDNLDFRDIEAFSDKVAYAMSSGEGRLSRLYKTMDGGRSWDTLRINLIPEGFWNAIAFWDEQHGILMGDPVKGRFTILTTADGGETWKEREGPKAERNEAAFAASGTALIARGSRDAWFVTGGTGGGRVLHSDDGGDTWTAMRTGLKPASMTAGLYSIAFDPSGHTAIAVGGDYTKPDDGAGSGVVSKGTTVFSKDGGKTWEIATHAWPHGYRSGVAYYARGKCWVTVGTNGTETGNEHTFEFFGTPHPPALNALSADGMFAVGPKGTIVRGGISIIE